MSASSNPRSTRRAGFRHAIPRVGMALALAFGLAWGFVYATHSQQPGLAPIHRGEADLTRHSFHSEGPVMLDGEWEFHWKRLLVSSKDAGGAPAYLAVPGSWNGASPDSSSDGFASYRLKLELDPRVGQLALRIPNLAPSYSMYFNGKLIARNGVVAGDEANAKPQYLPQLAFVQVSRRSNELVIETSNYWHTYGGLWASVILGEPEDIVKNRDLSFGLDLFLLGILLVTAVYHLLLFAFRPKDLGSLYYSAFCFLILFRLAVTGERTLIYANPGLSWFAHERAEFLTFYLSAPLFMLLVNQVYAKSLSIRAIRWAIGVACAWSAFTLLVSMKTTFVALPFYQALFLVEAAYILVGVVRAVLGGARGATLILAGVVVLVGTGVNDVLYAKLLTNTGFLAPVGLAIFTIFHSVGSAARIATAFRNKERLVEELNETNLAYSRFIPSEFFSLLRREAITEIKLGDASEKNLTILFSDIRGFTRHCANKTPEETFRLINEVLGSIGPPIRLKGGFIDKFLGDGVLALFPGSPDEAIAAALDMQEAIRALNVERMAKGLDPVEIGIGIHFGPLIVGVVGEEHRREATVISDAVNTASRVESLTKTYGLPLLVTQDCVDQLERLGKQGDFSCQLVDRTEIRGRTGTVALYRVERAELARKAG